MPLGFADPGWLGPAPWDATQTGLSVRWAGLSWPAAGWLDMKLNKMMLGHNAAAAFVGADFFITVILCPYMAWIVSRTWLSP